MLRQIYLLLPVWPDYYSMCNSGLNQDKATILNTHISYTLYWSGHSAIIVRTWDARINVYNQNQDCMQIPVEDNVNSELYLYFDTVADTINDVLSKNGKVMIYCKEGKSRSASLCIAYLVKGPFINYIDSFLNPPPPPPFVDKFTTKLMQYRCPHSPYATYLST